MTCNWCGGTGALAIGKPYCEACQSRCYREGCRCRRPFQSAKYFTEDLMGKRYNSCQRKYLKEMLTGSKQVQIVDADDTDGFSVSEESITELTEKKKKRTPPVKRGAEKITRPPCKKRKSQPDEASEALKTLLCQWSGDEDCMRKILGGRKMAFVPVFI